ncbi:MAG: hypothetical protein K2N95_19005 [Lachnospiraceae bacterium]|nr:hypothetical protein [Lachnospiraceae bacterium]
MICGSATEGEGKGWNYKVNLDRAIALYDLALEEFQKNPRDCKYDIERTQQLRGEAKRLKKVNPVM